MNVVCRLHLFGSANEIRIVLGNLSGSNRKSRQNTNEMSNQTGKWKANQEQKTRIKQDF